ncbi:PadR family transcriptional regulator [Actinoplanes sp. NPDC051494]|uniref:PadR family transcriptional regulator n=1 Tax=Actinoplanes sp. NPDC051494 TaxID=3363907 RepID=UPI0037946DA2
MTMDATLAGHLQELRRGTVVVASLTVLRSPGYGYSLLETLSAAGFEVEANTLYPLLRRLESQGLLTSEWNTDEARPRKFYRTTEQGTAVATAMRTEWTRLDRAVGDLGTSTTSATTTTASTATISATTTGEQK